MISQATTEPDFFFPALNLRWGFSSGHLSGLRLASVLLRGCRKLLEGDGVSKHIYNLAAHEGLPHNARSTLEHVLFFAEIIAADCQWKHANTDSLPQCWLQLVDACLFVSEGKSRRTAKCSVILRVSRVIVGRQALHTAYTVYIKNSLKKVHEIICS